MGFIKDYLSIDETLRIFTNKGIEADFEFLQDLEREGKLKPLIYLDTYFSTDTFTTKYHRVTAYFSSVNFILLDGYEFDYEMKEWAIFFGNQDCLFRIEKGIIRYTDEIDVETTGYIHCLSERDPINPEYYVEIQKVLTNQIRIRKSDLDELFNVSDIQKVQADTSDLEKRLETAREIYKTQIAQITQLHGDIGCLTIDNLQQAETIQQQADTIQQLNERLADKPKEMDTPAEPMGDNPLSIIMDTKKATYAPDLVHAINLWFDLYNNDNQSTDSHTNRANTWLKKNTGYENVKRGDKSMDRIREIATPLQSFGGQRAKEPEK